MNTQSWISRNRAAVAIVGCMVLVVVLSAAFFLKQSLRLDESQSLWQTSHSVMKIFNIIAQDVHVPLYHIMLHFWQIFFGNGVATARVFSLLFFVLAIPALFKLAKLLYGEEAAIFTILLFSISPFMNWYGNEIRMYSLFTLVVILNMYYFVRIYKERDSEDQNAIWFLYIVTVIAGIFTHYFFFFALFSELIFFITHRDKFAPNATKRFIWTIVLVVVAFAPWVRYVLHLGSISNSEPLLAPPTSVNVFNTFSQFLFGFQINYVNTILVSFWPVTILLGFLALRKRKTISADTAFLVICFIVPNILAFIVSTFVLPLYLSRYLIFTLPPMYMLLAALAVSYPPKIKKLFMGILISVMIVTLGAEIVSAQTPVKEDYKQVVNYIQSHSSFDDVIIVSAPFTIYPIDYYYKGPIAAQTLPIWNRDNYGPIPPFNESTLPQQVKQITAGSRNVWVVLSYDQGYEKNIHDYFESHYQKLYQQVFSPDLTLYEYKIRYP